VNLGLNVKKRRRPITKRDSAVTDYQKSQLPATNLTDNPNSNLIDIQTLTSSSSVSSSILSQMPNCLIASKEGKSSTPILTPKKTCSQIDQNSETTITSESTVVADNLKSSCRYQPTLPGSPFKSRKNALKSKAPIKNNRNSLSMPIFSQVISNFSFHFLKKKFSYVFEVQLCYFCLAHLLVCLFFCVS
jgi:hypothetical protein